jgi:tetrahydromethanopterin S-methyltransferase subunit G
MANIEFSNIIDLIDEVNNTVERMLDEQYQRVKNASQVGLDERSGVLYISKDAIIVSESTNKSLRYYGGMEYVDSEYVDQLGHWVIYKSGHHRVNEVINRFFGEQVVEDDFEEYDDE